MSSVTSILVSTLFWHTLVWGLGLGNEHAEDWKAFKRQDGDGEDIEAAAQLDPLRSGQLFVLPPRITADANLQCSLLVCKLLRRSVYGHLHDSRHRRQSHRRILRKLYYSEGWRECRRPA